ncbi:MAG: ATP-dependent endonuclease [Candidatus Hodarchaeota archaeon]
MKTITEIKIEKFRSCRSTEILNLGNLNIISGKNNTGKSNILRALSLFFTNFVEPNIPLNLQSDCSAKEKEKKKIRVSVKFNLSPDIKIQKTIRHVEELIPRDSAITKEFLLDLKSPSGYSVEYYINEKLLEIKEKPIVDQFLNLFNFRYITADRTPQRVLNENLTELKSELSFRINRKSKQNPNLVLQNINTEAFDELTEIARDIFEPVKSELTKADKNIHDVRLLTPDSLMELLNSATYQISTNDGGKFAESSMGSGIQSLLLFIVLFLVDRNYHRKFGWKIATLWAIEEPEIFLHFDLENQLANYLSNIAFDQKTRFQILCTSHSSTFPQYADSHYYVNQSSFQSNLTTTECTKYEPHKFLHILYENRISNFVNALTLYPMNPIILCEGDIDAKVIKKILSRHKISFIKVFPISEFVSNPLKKGETYLFEYLNTNEAILKNRAEGAGIIAVFDWDVDTSKINKLRKKISFPNIIYHFNKVNSNPDLDKSFRGIERFYPTNLITNFLNLKKGFILDKGENVNKGRFQVDSERYDFIKMELMNMFIEDTYSDDFFMDFIGKIKHYQDENYCPLFYRT